MSVFMIFIDGLGIGPNNPEVNPFLQAYLPTFKTLLGNEFLTLDKVRTVAGRFSVAVPTDARLGVPGIPQSATGQTAIFTGINAPLHVGEHINGRPTPPLIELIKTEGIFRKVLALGKRAAFINAYRDDSFAKMNSGTYKGSVTTVLTLAAGLGLKTLDDLRAGRAVYHDVTNRFLIERGYSVPEISPVLAGKRAASITKDYDFALFEHFLTDMAGHSQNMERAVWVLETLDQYLGTIMDNVDLRRDTVIITSDHGNIEDLSFSTHTVNPVPTIIVGAGKDVLAWRIKDLTDITPVVVDFLRDT